MTTKPDELDDILYKYVANRDMYLSDLEDEVITEKDWMRIRDNIQLDTKQAILDWHNKQVEALLDRLEMEATVYGTDELIGIDQGNIPLTAIEDERSKLKEVK